MEITIETLRELLPDFQQQRDDAIRKLGAVEGAIQFCNHLIAKLEESNNKEDTEGGEEKSPPKD